VTGVGNVIESKLEPARTAKSNSDTVGKGKAADRGEARAMKGTNKGAGRESGDVGGPGNINRLDDDDDDS